MAAQGKVHCRRRAQRCVGWSSSRLATVSYRVSVERHLQSFRSFPSLAQTQLPILRLLTRHGGLKYLGVEVDSAKLCLLVTRHLMLPQSLPRTPRKTPTLPRTLLSDRWAAQNNTNSPIITRSLTCCLQFIGGVTGHGSTPILPLPSGRGRCVEAEPLVFLAEFLACGSSSRCRVHIGVGWTQVPTHGQGHPYCGRGGVCVTRTQARIVLGIAETEQ